MKFLIGIGATVVDFVLFILVNWLCELFIGVNYVDTAMKILFVLSIIVAVIAYILCGGLSVAFSTVKTAFSVGMLFPIFPIDIACGIVLAGFAVFIVWIFPIVPIVVNHFFGDDDGLLD
jgi:hypothetical protein